MEHGDDHSPIDSIVVVNYLNADKQWCKDLAEQGYKLVIDHLWDSNIFERSTVDGNTLTLRNKNWCWYNEALWYTHLGYNSYVPNKNHTHAFLMMMNLAKPHRDQIIDRLRPILDSSLHSYIGRGIHIVDDTLIGDYPSSMHWERYFNPAWYDSTAFSVAVETMTQSPTFISEKIYKPMAYHHPLIVWGSTGTLQYLQDEGFMTMNHLIDESYDTIDDASVRLEQVATIVSSLTDQFNHGDDIFNDTETKQRLQHNNQRFFDIELITRKINSEILGDILDHFEGKK